MCMWKKLLEDRIVTMRINESAKNLSAYCYLLSYTRSISDTRAVFWSILGARANLELTRVSYEVRFVLSCWSSPSPFIFDGESVFFCLCPRIEFDLLSYDSKSTKKTEFKKKSGRVVRIKIVDQSEYLMKWECQERCNNNTKNAALKISNLSKMSQQQLWWHLTSRRSDGDENS